MSRRRTQGLQRRLVEEAARIVVEEGLNDYQRAKRKARRHLGLGADHPLPTHEDVEAAVLAHQRLFQGEAQRASLARQRRTAVAAMEMLAEFQPRLVGPVLSGAAAGHEAVTLHLFADTPETVEWFLHDRAIPFDLEERSLQWGKRGVERFPALCFVAGETPVELVVLPLGALRQPPSPPGEARPLPRAGIARVRALLAEDAPQAG